MAERTPSQTVGPFFHEALRWRDGANVTPNAPGKRIVLSGRMVDGAGNPVSDAMVEAWQANPPGFGRVETAKDGSYRFETAMPAGARPSLDITIFARGLLKPLRTRVYLADEAQVRSDPVLKPLASSPRLRTLVAARAGEGEFRWDVRLQGEGETVFFAA
jgi:protocatechuate 3,4-dioxygenase, alpha subunit